MRGWSKGLGLVLCFALIVSGPALAPAQSYVYPDKGQTQQQQDFDRGQCYSWAVQQTNFDPANPRVATGPPPPSFVGGQPQPSVFEAAIGEDGYDIGSAIPRGGIEPIGAGSPANQRRTVPAPTRAIVDGAKSERAGRTMFSTSTKRRSTSVSSIAVSSRALK